MGMGAGLDRQAIAAIDMLFVRLRKVRRPWYLANVRYGPTGPFEETFLRHSIPTPYGTFGSSIDINAFKLDETIPLSEVDEKNLEILLGYEVVEKLSAETFKQRFGMEPVEFAQHLPQFTRLYRLAREELCHIPALEDRTARWKFWNLKRDEQLAELAQRREQLKLLTAELQALAPIIRSYEEIRDFYLTDKGYYIKHKVAHHENPRWYADLVFVPGEFSGNGKISGRFVEIYARGGMGGAEDGPRVIEPHAPKDDYSLILSLPDISQLSNLPFNQERVSGVLQQAIVRHVAAHLVYPNRTLLPEAAVRTLRFPDAIYKVQVVLESQHSELLDDKWVGHTRWSEEVGGFDGLGCGGEATIESDVPLYAKVVEGSASFTVRFARALADCWGGDVVEYSDELVSSNREPVA